MSDKSDNSIDGIDFSLWTLDGGPSVESTGPEPTSNATQPGGSVAATAVTLEQPENSETVRIQPPAVGLKVAEAASVSEQERNADDWIVEGEAAFGASDLDDAARCFESALSTDPINAVALSNLGVVHHTRGQLDEAERFYLKAAAFNEIHADSYFGLAQLWCERGNHGLALRYAARGLVRQPEHPELIELATSLSQLIDAQLTELHPN